MNSYSRYLSSLTVSSRKPLSSEISFGNRFTPIFHCLCERPFHFVPSATSFIHLLPMPPHCCRKTHQRTESYPYFSCHNISCSGHTFLTTVYFLSPPLPPFFFSSPISFVGDSLKKLRKDGELTLFRGILLPFSTHACQFLSLF